MKALFIFAHPDDETFATGGTIAKLVKKGMIVNLICATRGEAGQIGNPPICTQKELGNIREQELRFAANMLGIKEIFFLGLIDGTLKDLAQKDITIAITTILKKENPDIVFTFDSNGGESTHPDHKSISKSATQAFERYAKEVNKHVRLYYRVTPRSLTFTTAVDVSETVETKMQAAAMHKSQHQDWERILLRKKHEEFNFEFYQLVKENALV